MNSNKLNTQEIINKSNNSFLSYSLSHDHSQDKKIEYKNEFPSIHHFGPLVKLVPMLELLNYGFNGLFIDANVILLQDPLQYLVPTGDSNIVIRAD
eukprot:gene16273-22167_t